MSTFIILVHVIVCVALILIVLLQTGKGAEMGAAFGGSSQTLFGGAGPASFLSKMTTIVAVVFMLTSLVLAYVSSHRGTSSVMSEVAAPQAQQTEQMPAQAPAKSETSEPVPAQPASEPANK